MDISLLELTHVNHVRILHDNALTNLLRGLIHLFIRPNWHVELYPRDFVYYIFRITNLEGEKPYAAM